ncbi:MAG: AAA family ATPase [Acholeplasmataceae bacterium]
MKLIIIFGDAAVGKMTVGQKLMELTKLRLFHNHMSIELIIEIFGYFHKEAIVKFRELVFNEFAATDAYGLIFTFMWALDQTSDWEYIQHITSIFTAHNGEVYYIELVADKKARLYRNETENRLKHKPSKRNLEWSRNQIERDNERYRLVSYEDEIEYPNYLKIDNTNLSPEDTALLIQKHFNL